MSQANVLEVVLVDVYFQPIMAQVLDRKDGHAGTGQDARVHSSFGDYAVKRSANAGVVQCRARLRDSRISLRFACLRHAAAGERRLVASLGLVELLRTYRLSFVKHLVTLEGGFGEREIRVGGGNLLLGSCTCGAGAITGSSLLGVVNYGQHLAPLDPVAFVDADLHDVPHRLGRELAGLGSPHRADRFQQVGRVYPLGDEDRRARCFWRCAARARFAGTTSQSKSCGEYKRYAICVTHGVTTGD